MLKSLCMYCRQGAATLLFVCALFCVSACKEKQKSSQPIVESEVPKSALVFKAGDVAPPIVLSDLDGRPFNVEKYRGKLVLVNFWGTFCPPCLAEMPALQRLYQKEKNAGLEIVAINLDPKENQKAVFDFVKNNRLSFTVVSDPDLKVKDAYGVTGVPETFVIDPEGKFVNVVDPVYAEDSVRITTDFPWDAPMYTKLVEDLISSHVQTK